MTERLIHTHTHTHTHTHHKTYHFFFYCPPPQNLPFFKRAVLMWIIFKVFIEFVTVLPLLFMFWFLAYRILVSPLPILNWKSKS